MELIVDILIGGLFCLGIYAIIKKKTALRYISFSLALFFMFFFIPLVQVLIGSSGSSLLKNGLPLGPQVIEGELGFIQAHDTIYNSCDYYNSIKINSIDLHIKKDNKLYLQNISVDSLMIKELRKYKYDSLLKEHKSVLLKLDCNVQSKDVCIGLKIKEINLIEGIPTIELR